ncbi:MAG TPA: FtsQ-type POTRA domain-containing protein [Vicinamibacterales bacterium]
MKVKAPSDKNFRRSRTAVRPVRKRSVSWWKSGRVITACAACLVGLYATYKAYDLVLHASALQIQRIVVHGQVRLSSGEVESLIGTLRGSNILMADLSKYRERLLGSPWVADAVLRRVLPSTVEVVVAEREPLALCRIRGELYLVDRTGMIIDDFGPRHANFDLPIVDGAATEPAAGEPLVDVARIALAARVIDDVAGDSALARRLSQIDVSDLHDAVVLLDGDPALLHLGTSRFAERLRDYTGLAARLRESVPEIDYADLQFDGRIYVKPAGATARRALSLPDRN